MKKQEIEIWETIAGYNGRYQASSLGRIKSLMYGKERILKSTKNNRGYFYVLLSENGKSDTKTVHRLIAETFISNPENLPVVRHLNDVQTDNRVENLAWGTLKDNHKDMKKNGIRSGSKIKLTKQLSEKIFKDYITGDFSQEKLANKYKVSMALVQRSIREHKEKNLKEIDLAKKKIIVASKKIQKVDVPKIRYRYDNALNTVNELAKEFNVSYCNMLLLVKRKIFKNVV